MTQTPTIQDQARQRTATDTSAHLARAGLLVERGQLALQPVHVALRILQLSAQVGTQAGGQAMQAGRQQQTRGHQARRSAYLRILAASNLSVASLCDLRLTWF